LVGDEPFAPVTPAPNGSSPFLSRCLAIDWPLPIAIRLPRTAQFYAVLLVPGPCLTAAGRLAHRGTWTKPKDSDGLFPESDYNRNAFPSSLE
jgi:hypothetical protein